jgi:hypothetical protein
MRNNADAASDQFMIIVEPRTADGTEVGMPANEAIEVQGRRGNGLPLCHDVVLCYGSQQLELQLEGVLTWPSACERSNLRTAVYAEMKYTHQKGSVCARARARARVGFCFVSARVARAAGRRAGGGASR